MVKLLETKFDQYTPVIFTVTSQICHAMSTQWIGHSATMSSWNETWLHVGLNKYLEKFCVDDVCLSLVSIMLFCKRENEKAEFYIIFSFFQIGRFQQNGI